MMRKIHKRVLSLSLAALLALGALCGCSDTDTVTPTQTSSTIPTVDSATSPLDKEDPMLHVTRPNEANTDNVAQIRLHNVRSGWMAPFVTETGAFLLATSVETLMDGLSKRGIDPAGLDLTAYDDVFFAENYLVVIPRSSNSGSVTYSARVEKTDTGVVISTVGKMPEVGTADMADWLVLVPLNTAEYPGVVTVENVKIVAPNLQRYAIHRY